MDQIVVKFVKIGPQTGTNDKVIDRGTTLGDFLRSMQETYVQGNVTIDRLGSYVRQDTVLQDNDRIFMGSPTKGNAPFNVQFVRLGCQDSTVINLAADDGFTIRRTIEQLDSSTQAQFIGAHGKAKYEYRIGNGSQPLGDDAVIPRPSSSTGSVRILCSQKTKGNLN